MTAPSDLEGLLARVEGATGWDDDLDVLIFMDVDPEYGRERKIQKVQIGNYPAYTGSVSHALALVERVLPGGTWRVETCAYGGSQASAWPDGITEWTASAKTPALALLAALLKALSARSGEGGPALTLDTPNTGGCDE